MKIAVISDHAIPLWSSRQILLALEKLGVTPQYVRPSELVSVFGEGEYSVLHLPSLKPLDVDGAILRDLGTSLTLETFLRRCNVIRHLEMLGTLVVNPIESVITARDKYRSLLLLFKAGIPVPKTYVLEDFMIVPKIVETWGKAVVKPIVGSMGFGVVMTENPDVAYTVARTLLQLKQPIYIQRYVEKPGRDIRVLVIGNEIAAAYYRVQVSPNAWKTNVAQGAKPVLIPKPDKELEDLALKVIKILNLHYAGIDVVESPDGYKVLEVNAAPQWKGLQKATGINPATKLATYVVSLIKR
ncbi:MAG: RimK family alpha-L-glutamate ligase [Desulfurococcaceae archaeon]|nr:RimK family alpha-L-glutamate ligase [Desulfurococcaceae archaeon]MCC6057902.1 RimK family alpha-L-glutamate ligase [Desulfurococcaceae archaeon]